MPITDDTLIRLGLAPPLSADEIAARDPLVRHRARKQAEAPEIDPHDTSGGLVHKNYATAEPEAQQQNGWDTWIKAWLDQEREAVLPAIIDVILQAQNDLRDEFMHKIAALELELARARGALDILSGKELPPPAKFPAVQPWEPDCVYHAGDVVAFAGSCFQAQRDTTRAPGTQDWVCLAVAGTSLTVRGTYDNDVEYKHLDVVAYNGSSWVALKDSAGLCPGSDWQLLSSCGKRGDHGPRGERGFAGPKGDRGEPGRDAPAICEWRLDLANYTVIPVLDTGREGAPLSLRKLFEQFVREVRDGR